MNKYENSGNLFPANNVKVFRQGTVDIDGADYEVIIVETTTKNGNKVYEAYFKGGALFINKEKGEAPHDYDISGEITIDDHKVRAWGRKKLDKNNNPYTRMSFAEAKSDAQVSEKMPKQEEMPDDDIPF